MLTKYRDIHIVTLYIQTDRQFETYLRFRSLKVYVTPNLSQSELIPNPTYLSHFIGCLRVFTMSLYIFKILFLLLFSYERHKAK